MAKKYIKCPRCELNYILEGEDFCAVCKSEMKHHAEGDDELLDIEDMELCPVCGQNYIKEGEAMCEDCRNSRNGIDEEESDEPAAKVWRESERDDGGISPVSDIDRDDDDYDAGYDSETESDDTFKEDDDLLGDDDILGDEPIAFEEEEDIEEEEETSKDDFEVVEPSADDDDEEEEEEDYDFEDDILSSKPKK